MGILNNKRCFISVLIKGKIWIFNDALVIEDNEDNLTFTDNKTGKSYSYARSLIQEVREL